MKIREDKRFGLILGLGIAVILILAFAAVSFAFVSTVRNYQWKDRNLLKIARLDGAAGKLQNLRQLSISNLRAYLLTGDNAFLVARNAERVKVKNLLSVLRTSMDEVEGQALIASIEQLSEKSFMISDKAIQLKRSHVSMRTLTQYFNRTVVPIQSQLNTAIMKLVQYKERNTSSTLVQTAEQTFTSIRSIFLATAIAFILSVLVGWVVATTLGSLYDKIRVSETRFRAAVEALGEVSWTHEIADDRIHWSEGLSKNWGYPESVRDTNLEWWLDRIHPEDRERVLASIAQATESTDRFISFEFRFRKPDGNYVSAISHAFFILDSKGQLLRVIGASSDVTYLRQAIQSRDEMVGVISHELKNPLTAIGTGFEVLMRTLPPSPTSEKVQHVIQAMVPSVVRMNRLISDLLDVTRLEAKTLSIERGFQNIPKIVEEVVEAHLPIARKKSIDLQRRVAVDLPPAYCDRQRVVQILSNLVGNALKYTGMNGAVTVDARRVGDEIQISVIDSGPGISEENQKRVFDRFWQSKNHQFQGTGLGLSIAKGLVEAQGGRIWLKSQVGQGSTFTFSLPLSASISSAA